MELKDFISQTLVEIQAGTHDAIHKVKALGVSGVINPVWEGPHMANRGDIQKVQFDIAVTIAESATGTAEGGVKVVGIKLGANGSSTSESSNVSRIQFSIPVIPPMTSVLPESPRIR